MDLARAWNNLEGLRSLSDVLQWAAIVLVFLGGVLQVATMVVNRREKTLEAVRSHPRNQLITTGTATVEVLTQSDEAINTTFMDSGGYALFGKGEEEILGMGSQQASARQLGDGHVVWRIVTELDARHPSVGRPLSLLDDAEFLQAGFMQMRRPAKVTGGTAVVIMNGQIRMEFAIPAQEIEKEYVIVRDLKALGVVLK